MKFSFFNSLGRYVIVDNRPLWVRQIPGADTVLQELVTLQQKQQVMDAYHGLRPEFERVYHESASCVRWPAVYSWREITAEYAGLGYDTDDEMIEEATAAPLINGWICRLSHGDWGTPWMPGYTIDQAARTCRLCSNLPESHTAYRQLITICNELLEV